MNPLAGLAARLQAATPRERMGLSLLAALAAIFMAFSAFEWAMNSGARAEAAALSRARAEAIAANAGERAFQEQVALAAGKVWRWSVVEQSAGVARAQASGALEALALGAGLGNVAVAAQTGDEPAPGEIGALTLTLNADFEWGSFVGFLRTLEASEISFSVEAVEVTPAADRPATFEMRLRTPFLHEAPP
jgi:hypothetical protein